MTRLLYLDCVGGAAGDMLLGALLDAGADAAVVEAGLARLSVDGLALPVDSPHRHGIRAAHATITGAPRQPRRDWRAIRDLVDRAELPPRARDRAQEVFRRLAHAEASIHGVDPEAVHFHEVGGVDAIGEVCGVALALEALDVERVVCSPLPVARGLVDTEHGRLPLPAPAALELLVGAPVHGVELDGELVTPTGAALVAALADEFGPLPAMTLAAVGYGAGTRDLDALPNVVRAIAGTAAPTAATRPVSLVEANLDDLVPELAPDAAAACFAAGALDVWTTPAQMKQGRPGFTLSALARPGDEEAVAEAILRETSSLGVRIARLQRWELERDWRTVEVDGEPVRVKVGRLDGRIVNMAPEHADCERVAHQSGAPVKVVWARALAAAQEAP